MKGADTRADTRADTGADTGPYLFVLLSSAIDLSLEKKTGNICKRIVKNEEMGRIHAQFYLIATKIILKTPLKHINIDFPNKYLHTKWRQRHTFELYKVTTTS